jgi:hypothetical protein
VIAPGVFPESGQSEVADAGDAAYFEFEEHVCMGDLPNQTADDPGDRRAFDRLWIYRSALLSVPGHISASSCSVRDFTTIGAGLRLNGIILLPLEFHISFDWLRICTACRLIWRDGDFAGLIFLSPVDSRLSDRGV